MNIYIKIQLGNYFETKPDDFKTMLEFHKKVVEMINKRITTLIKAELKKLDDHTNIVKFYRISYMLSKCDILSL